jgi:hypothetical protein
MKPSLSNVLTAVALLGALGGVWGTLSADGADTKRRVTTVEQRQAEDRKDTRAAIHEVKEHVKLIDQNTQLILQEVRAMQAVQRAERRERQ